MSFEKPDSKYWDHKLAAYLHDPFDKAFDIKGHEERAAQLLEIFGLDLPNEKYWKKADGIASGFERGQVPTYSRDENKNGAVNFINNNEAIITHPIGKDAKLHIDLSQIDAKILHEKVKQYLEKEIGTEAGQSGYSKYYPDQPDRFAMARFLYAHLVLRFKLAKDNIAGLGALWHRLPADTRFPDHSIWQHNALTSALTSCMELAGDENSIGLMVFSITPVQGFIANARKLRDFWTGSVILSWLAFEGLRWVIENLGPDHVIYPSLIDQPLINEYLKLIWHIEEDVLTQTRDIASLPNKFVVLIPLNKVKEIGNGIQDAIRDAWQELIKKVEKNLVDYSGLRALPEISHLTKMIQEQTTTFWELRWAAAKLIGETDVDEITRLLPHTAYTNQVKLLKILNKIIEGRNYQNSGMGTLYSVSHHLAQSALAVQKMQRSNQRPPQNGEKCSMCGEFEALHSVPYVEGQKASEYKQNVKVFWDNLSNHAGVKVIKENEHLCAICYTKRMGYRILKQYEGHILNATFKNSDSFPSTTRIAITNWCKHNGITGKECNEIADKIHEQEEKKEVSRVAPRLSLDNSDKYYAILMMDGDRMGKLINGETIAATWKSIMHPQIVKRLEDKNFDALFRENWKKIFSDYPGRFITPSIHAAISEALADFSIYGVKPIIQKYDGRLIYAGGDDVCAVLPWQNAVQAAREIRNFYISTFKIIRGSNKSNEIDLTKPWHPIKGKLSLFLGKGENISISGAILIAHHKDNLGLLIKRAHDLLDIKAKKESGRNALAIELKKRSGGSRFFTDKWDSPKWDSFLAIQNALSKESVDLSRSLLYKLKLYEDGIYPLLNDLSSTKLESFILALLMKSDTSKNSVKNEKKFLSKYIGQLLSAENNKLSTDALIIASFLAQKEAR